MIHDYQTPDRGWCGDRTRGASMGRTSDLPKDVTGPLQLRHVPLNSGGYDPGGAYWGSPDNLYMAEDGEGQVSYLRASSLEAARKEFPKATFPVPSEVTEADIDDMLQGYIECALWSSTGDDDRPLDDEHSDVTSETRASMREDCARFARENAADLIAYVEKGRGWSYAGHDFWLTRNRHGAGFWDRGLGALGERLSDAARKFSEAYLYVGDDGEVYSS